MARAGHKKIDEWEWKKPGVATIKVPVYLNTGRFGPVDFSVELPELNIVEHNPDIAALQKVVFAILEGQYKIEWQPFFLVKYSGKHTVMTFVQSKGGGTCFQVEDWDVHFEEHRLAKGLPNEEDMHGARPFHESMEFSLGIEEVLLGTYPSGEKCWRHRHAASISHDWPSTNVKASKKGGHWDPDVQALLPATMENRRGLHELLQAFARMDLKLMELLNQGSLQQTLQQIIKQVGLLALPAPEKPQGPPEKIKIVSERQEHFLLEEARKARRKKRGS